jgi:glycerol-3-phosphate O-acyltransferase
MKPYEPNAALAWLYHRFFEHIEVDASWATTVREVDRRGTVVYVLRNLSFVDFFALDWLTKRLHLPEVRFANDLGLSVFEPMGKGWLRALAPRSEDESARELQAALTGGSSAALFLKRPPTLTDPAVRGKTEGDVYLHTLLRVQRARKTPLVLVPQVFVWSKSPDRSGRNLVDAVFGPREWPGKLRTVTQFLMNYRHVTMRAGEPVDLAAFLDQNAGATDDVLVRRLVYTLLRRLERERQAVLGPAKKPRDRVKDEVLRSPKLSKIIGDMAGEGAAERRVLHDRAAAMLDELSTDLDMNALNALDAAFERTVARMYTGFEIDQPGLERLRALAKEGTLVLLPSHKSHVDYMVLSRVFYRAHLPVPTIAAGDNLDFFPVGPILRKGGAFFIRRSFKNDRLYGAVVDAYVRRLILDGASLEFYLEGGRSRTGKLLPPKLGLLNMVVSAALSVDTKVFFCPISIGYERVVEEEAYAREIGGGEKPKEDVRGLFSAAETLLGRYGRVTVQFGQPVALEDVVRDLGPASAPPHERPPPSLDAVEASPALRRKVVSRLAYRVMNEINEVTAVTSGAVVATALLTHERRGLAHADLVLAARSLVSRLRAAGARFSPALVPIATGELREEALSEALDLFIRAGHVVGHRPGVARTKGVLAGAEIIYTVPDEARILLDLSKNIIVHFFVAKGTIATSFLSARAPEVDPAILRERVQWLSRLWKYEFQYRADASFEDIFAATLAGMFQTRELVSAGNGFVRSGDDPDALRFSALVLGNFVEAYRLAARGLGLLVKGPLSPKELSKRTLAAGERMFLAGEIARREAMSKPVLENAHQAFVDMGYLARADGKWRLPESYASADAIATVERRIGGYGLAAERASGS